jgi:hypothetical protein
VRDDLVTAATHDEVKELEEIEAAVRQIRVPRDGTLRPRLQHCVQTLPERDALYEEALRGGGGDAVPHRHNLDGHRRDALENGNARPTTTATTTTAAAAAAAAAATITGGCRRTHTGPHAVGRRCEYRLHGAGCWRSC